MTRTYATFGGYHSKSQLEKIRDLMQGKSYMHFDVSVGCAGGTANCILGVSTDHEDVTQEELKEFFTWGLINELAEHL